MKTQYRNLLWLAALPLAFAMGACQNEDIVEAGQSANVEGQIVLRATMGSYNAPQSRAQVELGNEDESQEVFMWNAEDAFTVYDTGNAYTQHIFTISGYNEESPSAEAMFIGEGEISEGTEVTAIYPAQESSAVSGDVVTLTLPQTALTDGADEAWKSYMSQNMFMYAQATMAGANTALTFNQLCAMVRISYTNATDTDQNISKVTLTGDGNYFGNSMNFNLKTYEGNVMPTTSASLEFANLTVASGRTVDFYLLFFPGDDASNGKLTVSLDENQVEMSLSDMTTKAFEAGKRYWLNVMQTKADGLIWKKDVAEGVIANLPLIRVAEEENGIPFTRDENGFVNVEENRENIGLVKHLYLSDRGQEIDNLEGLEYFVNLEELRLVRLGVQFLNVSKFAQLKVLDCSENELTELDVTQNDNLEVLNCNSNNLSKLDLSKNVALTDLHCCENSLGTLDLTNNENLLVLDCFNAGLSELNLKNNTKLLSIYCGLNQLKELDVSQNKYLRYVDLTFGRDYGYGDSETPANYMTSLDFSNNPEIYYLRVSNCQLLTSLNISKNSKLLCLECGETSLSELNVSGNPLLETLVCTNNKQLKTLDVSNNLDLEVLDCNWSAIISLDVSKNTSLVSLGCACEDLTSLNISSNSLLRRLDCRYSRLTELDLSANVELTRLECSNAHLSELDITNNSKLIFRDEGGNCHLYCGGQYDDNYNYVPLTLYLTSEQLSKWEDVQWEGGNEEVNPVVQEPSSN